MRGAGGTVGRRAAPVITAPLLSAGMVLMLSTPGHAHPYGPPPRATISADTQTVIVEWEVAADDAFSLGEHLELVEPGTGRRQVAGILVPEEQQRIADRLAGAQEVASYAESRVVIRQGEASCTLVELDVADLVRKGATYEFTCPGPVDDIDVSITLLHDVNQAYRTFATADDGTIPERAVFTVDDPTQRWRFITDADDTLASSGGVLAGVAALAMAGMAAALRLLRKTTDHNSAKTEPDTDTGG